MYEKPSSEQKVSQKRDHTMEQLFVILDTSKISQINKLTVRPVFETCGV